MKVLFSKKDIATIQREVRDWYRIDLSETRIRHLLHHYPQVVVDMLIGVADTATREAMLDAIAQHVTDSPCCWPTGSFTKTQSQQFFEMFSVEAPLKGYKLLPNPKEWLKGYIS